MAKTKDSEVEERPKWDNKAEYLLTCIGFAVGVGNVWRFPYLCQIYGGGAFLIPYLIALVFEGLPLLYLEMAIGQRLRMGSIGVWKSISPLLGGVGIASMIVSFLVSIFYNTLLAWAMWYFFHSFQNPLPWSQCPVNDNLTGYNEECAKSTPANYFWYRETLNITPDIETSGSLQWWLVICLASAWCVVYICFIRGIQSIGKAVYVTTTFPYLVLTIFLIRALTLPGSTDGLVYLFTPDWEILKNPQVWLDAATQIFFSLSVAFGSFIAFSSYNAEMNNCERDAVLVGVINSATSLYASICIFSILGFKANSAYNSCNEEYSASGTGLAFIVISEAVIEMPGSQIWAILFFTMLFSLAIICLIAFSTALIFTLGSGNYWFEIFNGYVGSLPLLIVALFEIIGVIYVYGMKRFSEDIYFMTGKKPNIFWKACWMVISPLMLLVVLVAYVVVQAQKRPSYLTWNPDYELFPKMESKQYPDWVFAIIILLSLLPVISIPLVALYKLISCRMKKTSARAQHSP
ncbi:hypothetical protein F7725_024858 [Dissostichus mawsoni]|uniref:Transporter n=1 Tax=Dissostichus mawsoni TaxID=36200 RepID=A0A7J5X9G8_DISMA|nr:hypothetical protein F7725_024858 [Dissostichus mawsoni]